MSQAESSSNQATLPIALGFAGLIPFALCAMTIAAQMTLPLIGNADSARDALVVYAVAILSFTGGIRWGLAMPDLGGRGEEIGKPADKRRNDRNDQVAAAAPRDLWMLCIAFIIFGLLDYGLACRTVAPEWFGRLRIGLAAAAATCIAVAAIFE
jgi:Protein of unknown function (DUF3429)